MTAPKTEKINVAILFGGKSAEHEISLLSAKSVFAALNKEKYNPLLIGIDKTGQWILNHEASFLLHDGAENTEKVGLLPESKGEIINFSNPITKKTIDVVFPVLHGPLGEDGTIQGLLKLAHVPFVGSSVLGSALGMDKDVMKRLLRDAHIPVAKFKAFMRQDTLDFSIISKDFGLPFFIKPANMGSSVGIHKVNNADEFSHALSDAFQYDRKILIEAFIQGREIECAVLGNDNPMASVPGELIVHHDFYSYQAKYLDEKGASISIPANISREATAKIQALAIQVFNTLCCEGLARVDFFLKDNGGVFVNEINTMPGFTPISMYPKLWEASGVSYSELIDKLIMLAIERFEREQQLKITYET